MLCADETHWTTEPYVQREWCHKGKKTRVIDPPQAANYDDLWALHLHSQKVYWKRASRGTSQGFIAFLHQLHQRFPEAIVLLILDNATIHKSLVVKRFVKQHAWIELEHFAPYSPEYNPIERFWKWLKAKVYGATAFGAIVGVIGKVRQILWHYNEGWLISTIRFTFEPYQKIL